MTGTCVIDHVLDLHLDDSTHGLLRGTVAEEHGTMVRRRWCQARVSTD